MNQFYRATHMPLKRLLRKLSGEKEIYTIALRRWQRQPGADPLPALGGTAYKALPRPTGFWFADPMLYHYGAKRWLFAERMNLTTEKGDIVAWELDDDLNLGEMHPVLEEPYHLSFPNVFDWNGEIWMVPETGANKSLNFYRCTGFPEKWELVSAFPVDCSLADTILLEKAPDVLTLLCSEVRPENGLYVRYRRYYLRCKSENLFLEEDEAFNLQHKAFDLTSRSAGPLFLQNDLVVHPTQISTDVDYGVYLQFLARRGASEVPMCAASPDNVTITGIDPQDYIGVHTYCRDDEVEVIDLRYLAKIEKIEKPEKAGKNAKAAPQPAAAPAQPPQVEVSPEEELQQELEKAHRQGGAAPAEPIRAIQTVTSLTRELPEDLPELPSLEEIQHSLQQNLKETAEVPPDTQFVPEEKLEQTIKEAQPTAEETPLPDAAQEEAQEDPEAEEDKA